MKVSAKRLQRLSQSAAERRSGDMYLYRIIKRGIWLPFRLAFRPLVEGKANLPQRGGVVLVANHRSFFDSFFQGLVLDRPVHWMAKSELFAVPGIDRLLVRLGAFPVVRGGSDQQAIKVALALLEAGEVVAVFPEGTRVRSGLGSPRKGAARLAIDSRSPTVPMAIVGTEKGVLRRSLWHQGERVRMSIGVPIAPVPKSSSSDAADELTDALVWPQVETRVRRLEGKRREALALGAASILAMATLLAKRRRRRSS